MTTIDDDHTAERNKMGSTSELYELAGVEATLNDAEQRARKGKAKIVSKEEDNVFIKKKKDDDEESEKKKFFSHVPRKIRPALRYPQPNFENPNGASTSSSSPCSSTLPFGNYIPDEYKKTEMKNPSNTNHQCSPYPWLTEYTNPTEVREMLQRRSSGGFKKPKVTFFPRRTWGMPWWQFQVMRDMNGEDLTLILEKTLSKSDVNPTLGRLLMPFNSLIRNEFLTPEERSIIEEDIDNDDDDEKMEVGAILVDPRFEKWGVVLKKWEVGNHSGNVSWNYCLTCGWNDVVKANDLKDGDNIGVWAFRCGGVLCFALVPLSFTMRSQGRSYLRF